MNLPYADRSDAGRVLAGILKPRYGGRADVLVLALPRGGVPVAYEVARELDVPLDVMIVRKLGMPGQEELAIGAIASGGVQVRNEEVLQYLDLPDETIEQVARKEWGELQRREHDYRGDRPPPDVKGKTVILIDDGLATGSTMVAAVRSLRQRGPAAIVIAVPVAPPDTCASLAKEVGQIVCAATPELFGGVGRWYEDFTQTTDDQVRELLADAAQHQHQA